MDDQDILSVFNFHSGPIKNQKNGYRIKTAGFDLAAKEEPIWDTIHNIPQHRHRTRLQHAYTHLMSRTDSHYTQFTQRHIDGTLHDKYSFHQALRIPFIETAIWPILYHRDDLCESQITPTGNLKHSKKRHFFLKCLSPILDFSLFNLLHFQYDRWLFEIITGTIESGKKAWLLCCNRFGQQAHLPFILKMATLPSSGHSETSHFPSLFVTISADEWRINKPFWTQERYNIHGLCPTGDAFAETCSIIHTLQQTHSWILRRFQSSQLKNPAP